MKEDQPIHEMRDERGNSSPEGKEYPFGRSILNRLKKMVNEDWGPWPVDEQEDLVKALYLTEREVCIPEHLVGEDLMDDIVNLFYYPLAAVREELEQRTGTEQFIHIFVQPSYLDTSFGVMVAGEKVLLTVSCKAWNFFWVNEEEMVRALESWYRSAETRLQGGARLFADDAWALQTLLHQVRGEDIPRLEADNPWRAKELCRAADLLSRLLEEPNGDMHPATTCDRGEGPSRPGHLYVADQRGEPHKHT
ncbi:MAG: hypothetical protein H5T64_10575 [Chloroflexi bacterium]|nr:hypothetical protein [Chloroflexota bacterium]